MDSKETKQAVTAPQVSDAASKEAPDEGGNPSAAGNKPEKKSGHGTLKLILSFIPSAVLIFAGLRMKWLARGTALLFMDSAAGKRLSGWWILIALGVVTAVMIPVLRAVSKNRSGTAKTEPEPDTAGSDQPKPDEKSGSQKSDATEAEKSAPADEADKSEAPDTDAGKTPADTD